MQRWRFVLLDLIAAGVWAACFYSPAAATESGPAPDSEALDARVSNVTPKLDVWPACSSRESLAYADRICIKEGNHPDRLATYKIVFGLLHAGVSDSAALCVLDNSIIQSLNECFDSNSGKKWDDFTYVGLASLMHQLARNWRRQGVFERADQLYQQAYPMVAQNRLAPDRGTSILQDWALLKVDLGEVPAAIELANRQAALAKETHRCYTGFEGLLRNALEFQVAFFEKLGDSNSADHFRKELNSLGTPERCDGLCVSEPRKAEDQCN